MITAKKTCKIHGELSPENMKPQRNINKSGITVTYKCRLCSQASDLKSYHKNKSKKRIRTRIVSTREIEYEKNQITNLGDRYVIKKLIGTTKLKAQELKNYPALIDLKRQTLLLKRTIRGHHKNKQHRRITSTCDPNNNKIGQQ